MLDLFMKKSKNGLQRKEDEGRLYSFTLKDTVEAGYMRFTLLSNGANAIITVNEEIV